MSERAWLAASNFVTPVWFSVPFAPKGVHAPTVSALFVNPVFNVQLI